MSQQLSTNVGTAARTVLSKPEHAWLHVILKRGRLSDCHAQLLSSKQAGMTHVTSQQRVLQHISVCTQQSLLCGNDQGLSAVHSLGCEDAQALNQAGRVGGSLQSCQLTVHPLFLKPGGVAYSLHSTRPDNAIITQHLRTASSKQASVLLRNTATDVKFDVLHCHCSAHIAVTLLLHCGSSHSGAT